jgi:hypothetical protein
MPLVKLSIKDRFSESVLEKIYTCPDISIALDKFRTKYPDFWVSLVAVEDNQLHNAIYGGDFAFCGPLNMTKDEILVMNDEMDLKAYQMKWYPKSTDNESALHEELSRAEQELLAEMETEDQDKYDTVDQEYD